jgi:hypothetical protein
VDLEVGPGVDLDLGPGVEPVHPPLHKFHL